MRTKQNNFLQAKDGCSNIWQSLLVIETHKTTLNKNNFIEKNCLNGDKRKAIKNND